MPRKKQTNIEQPELIAEEAAEYIVSPDEEALRAEYRQRLAEALKDPAFRQIEGFPIGEDEAILALSDPPYYTACPNPFLNEIVEKWRQERAALRDELGLPNDEPAGSKYAIRENMPTKNYHREPFAADVSEGKNDPIYNAHSYHTKVPHKAIMRYILHYTDPGDVVLDGFCGTGMTGVAAQLCGDKKTVESLGYTVKDGVVYDENNKPISRLGSRKVILNDLSPAATFISNNYNVSIQPKRFEREANQILNRLEEEFGWMYETTHTDGKSKGRINYTIWSDVFLCPHCGNEMIFWDLAVNVEKSEMLNSWNCPSCSTLVGKSASAENGIQKVERAWETIFDRTLGTTIKQIKQVPVLINYSVNGKRHNKKPSVDDLQLIQKISDLDLPDIFRPAPLPEGEKTHDPINLGATHVHHLYTQRNLRVLLALWAKAKKSELKTLLLFLVTSFVVKTGSRLHNIGLKNKGINLAGAMPNALYIPSGLAERNIIDLAKSKISSVVGVLALNKPNAGYVVNTQSSGDIRLVDGSLDYIFIDPPFGGNLMYSELNYPWEAWLSVFTNNLPEAIINRTQNKKLFDYQNLMSVCFVRFFNLLKPGHWITVEFHNTQNAVWNSIQESMMSTGFMVADVRVLDKKQGSYNQMTASGAVQQDLVISAYKPTTEFEQRFLDEGGTVAGAWDFMRQHLEQLPLPNIKDGSLEALQERFPYLLYDRMVAFHIQRGLTVPLSAPEFYQGLSQRFLEREGMVFTAAQAAAYDKLRLQAERVEQLALFVTDESSARQWLRQELEHEPKTYGDIMPKFVQQLHQSKYEDLPELKVILEQAFLQDEKGHWYVPDPERAADLEKLRQNALLREFNEYRKGKGRLKVFRSEAVRAGFSNAWREREYDVIVEIAERMPESVLQEDQQLLMYYHNAGLRQSSEPRQENLL